MKRFGICFRGQNSGWDAVFVDAHSEQEAIEHLLWSVHIPGWPGSPFICIGYIVEWRSSGKGDPNGQYILTAQ